MIVQAAVWQRSFVLISLLYPKEVKRKLTELLFTLQKLRLDDKMYAENEKCRNIRDRRSLSADRKGKHKWQKIFRPSFPRDSTCCRRILKSTIIMSRYPKKFPYIHMITMSFTFFWRGMSPSGSRGSSIL